MSRIEIGSVVTMATVWGNNDCQSNTTVSQMAIRKCKNKNCYTCKVDMGISTFCCEQECNSEDVK